MTLDQLLIVYGVYLCVMSLLTFVLFLHDKNLAKKNGGPKRVKEKTLLGAVSLGGALGGFIGRLVAHHKTDKGYFSLTIYLSLLLQIGVFVLIFFLRTI